MAEHRYKVGETVREQVTGAAGVVLARKWWVALLTEEGAIDQPAAEPGYWIRFTDGREKNVLESELKACEVTIG